MKKRIYVAGPMTGLPDLNFPAFHEAAKRFAESGWKVQNPAENFGGRTDLSRATYMRADVAVLLRCHAIAMLPGWEQSPGAKLEYLLARELDLPVYDAVTLLPLEEPPGVWVVVHGSSIEESVLDEAKRLTSADRQNAYPHYAINSRIIAVHGWSHARHATKNHLQMSQGKSVIHGHTHRADSSIIQNIWSASGIVEARSAGCLCKAIPLYGTGRPVEWVNAFIIGYLGRRSDTLYTVPILDDRCILPDGTEVRGVTA